MKPSKENLAQIIEQAKQEWEATVDSLPQFICLFDSQMRVIRANRIVERWELGPVVEVKGKDIHSLLHPDCASSTCYLKIFLSQARTDLAQGQSTEIEANDELLKRHLQLQVRPVFTQPALRAKTSASFGTLVISDITIRKRMEQALQQANEELEQRVAERTAALTRANAALRQEIAERKLTEQALRKSKKETQSHARKWEALNKASQAVASTLDRNSVLKQITVEIQTLLEAERASVLLHNVTRDDLIFAAVANADAELLLDVRLPVGVGIAGWVIRERQAVLVNDAQRDLRFYDGIDKITGRTTHSLLAVPLIVKEKIIGLVEVINKISGPFEPNDLDILDALASSAAVAIENARLYEAEREQFRRLQQSQAQLVQVEKMAALGRLVASIAHEINNPLQSVQGFLNLLGEELSGRRRREKVGFYLDVAGSEIERIATIVSRMRDFYRPAEQGQHNQPKSGSVDDFYRPTRDELQSINVLDTLESVLQLANKKLQNNRITVERLWNNELPEIEGHSDHLKQVFLNLILNAVDAMTPDGGTLRVEASIDQAQLISGHASSKVRLEFSDTGIGMSGEELSRLFEPLFSTKEHGSGFGLFTSYKIVEAHQGQITATSQPGVGTTFTILLPVVHS